MPNVLVYIFESTIENTGSGENFHDFDIFLASTSLYET